MELGYGNAKEGRSTSLATDLWIKTNQNALKFQIGPKHEYGLFFGNFQIYGENKRTRLNPWQPKAADTICCGLTRWGGPIFMDSWA